MANDWTPPSDAVQSNNKTGWTPPADAVAVKKKDTSASPSVQKPKPSSSVTQPKMGQKPSVSSTSNVEVFTGFPGKEKNEYRVINNQWQKKEPGKGWDNVNHAGAIIGLNKQFKKNITPNEGFEGISSKLIDNSEEQVVPYLQKNYGHLGFKFQQTGVGDRVEVFTEDGRNSETFMLDNWTDDGDASEAVRLKAWLKENTQTLDRERYAKVDQEIENLTTAKPKEKVDLKTDAFASQSSGIPRDLSLSVEDQMKLTQKDKEAAVYNKNRMNTLVGALAEATKSGDKNKIKEAQARVAAVYDNNEIAKQSRYINDGLNDAARIAKSYENKVNQYNEELTNYQTELSNNNGFETEELRQKRESLDGFKQIIDGEKKLVDDALKTSKQDSSKLDIMAAERMLHNESKGSTGGAMVNSFLKGATNIARFAGLEKSSQDQLIQAIGSDYTEEEYMNSGSRSGLEQVLFGLSRSMGALAGGAGVGGAASFYADSYYSMRDEIDANPEFNNVPEAEKVLLSTVYGLTIGWLEKFGVDKIVSKTPIKSTLINKILTSTIKTLPKGATAEMIEEAVQTNVKAMLAKGAINVTGGYLAEAGTEGAQELAGGGMKELYNTMKDKEIFNTPESLLGSAFEAAVLGGLGGAIMQTPVQATEIIRNGISNKNKLQAEIIEGSVKDAEIKSMLVGRIKADIIDGKITKQEGQEQIEAINQAATVFEKLPENISGEQRQKSFDLILERSKIEKEIAGKDENLVSTQKNRIVEINNELKTISENAIQEQTTGEYYKDNKVDGQKYETVYRGQPSNVSGLSPKNSIWVTKDFNFANEYGDVKEYKLPKKLNLLDTEYYHEWEGLVDEFDPNGDYDEYKYEPTDEFIEFLSSKGYDGFSNGDNILIFDNKKITDANYKPKKESKNATKESTEQQQEVTAEGGGVQYQGTEGGQQEAGTTEGGQREAAQPETDSSNRVVESGSTKEEVNTATVSAHKQNGGSSISQSGEDLIGKPGYSVSIHTDRTQTIDGADITEQQLDEYKQKNADLLEDPNNFVGTWFDQSSGKTYLDISTYETDLNKAKQMGIDANQKAIFDLQNIQEVDTGGTGEVSPQVTQQVNEVTNDNSTETINRIAAETKDDRKISVAKAARSVLKAVPGVKVFLHNSTDEYRQAIADREGKTREDIDVEEGDGVSSGSYMNGEIHIDLSVANSATVFHEAFHHLFAQSGFKSGAARTMAEGLKKVVKDKALVDKISEFETKYEGETDEAMAEEFLAELAAVITENQQILTPTNVERIKQLVNAVAKKLGMPAVFSKADGRKEVLDFMNTVSKGMREGRNVTELTTRKTNDPRKRRIDVNNVRSKDRPGKRISKGLSVTGVGTNKMANETDDLSIEYVKKNAPNVFISNARIIAKYPIVSGKKMFGDINDVESAQKVYDVFVREVADNLKYLIGEFDPEFKDISTLWYDGANIIANDMAANFGVTAEQAAGIIASLSPQKDWYQNVRLAELTLMAFKDNPVITKEMISYQEGVNNIGLEDKMKAVRKADKAFKSSKTKLNKSELESKKEVYSQAKEKADAVLKMLSGFVGSNLNDVPQFTQPYFVRTYHEVNTTKNYDVITPDGQKAGIAKKQDGSTKKVAWGSYTEIGKAVSIYNNGSQENITKSLGEMHKIRNFYNNIIDPMSKDGDVTIDTHAVAAALLLPLSGNTVEVSQNFGTGTSNSGPFGIKGLYYAYSDAYALAAKEEGLLPRQVQSITWEAVRGLYKDTFKSQKNNVDDIRKIWGKYENGEITISEARKLAKERAGGIEKPTWAGGPIQDESGEVTKEKSNGSRSGGDGQSSVGAVGRKKRMSEPVAGNKLFNEPLKDASRIAEDYSKKSGITYVDPERVTKLDEENSKDIAAEYDRMKNDPTNPEVKAAYDAMIKETVDQYDEIVKNGYFVEVNNEEPYSSSEEMIKDLRDNKRMKIFSTESGFGEEPITDEQRAENPLLQKTKYTDVNGVPLLANDLFRFVHDFFGHAKFGNGFGPVGEENAWRIHSAMYSEPARRAMTSETRGQNSWVNFSGVNDAAFKLRDKARELRKQGKIDEANELVGQVYEEMKFADQKVGLMPEWVSETGGRKKRMADKKPKIQKEIDKSFKKPVDKVTVNEATALKDQLRLEAKAAREAAKDIKDKQRALIAAVKSMARTGKIKTQTAANLIKRVGYLNLDNQTMVEKFLQYAGKLFERADYQARLDEANKLRREIKKSSKKDIQAELVGMAKAFTAIEPSIVEDIDGYIEMARRVAEGIKPSSKRGNDVIIREQASIQEINDFTDAAIEAQDKYLQNELKEMYKDLVDNGTITDDMSLAQMKEIIDAIYKDDDSVKYDEEKVRAYIKGVIDTYAGFIQTMLKSGQDPFTGETLDLDAKQKVLMVRLLEVDTDLMDVKSALKVVDAMSGFMTNKITSGVEAIVAANEALRNMEDLAKTGFKAKSIKFLHGKVNITNKVSIGRGWSEQIASITTLSDTIFGGVDAAIKALKAMGYTAFENGVAKATKLWDAYIEDYSRVFKKAKPNGKKFNDVSNIYERGMFAFLSRTVIGTNAEQNEELSKKIGLLKQSIEVLSKGTVENKKQAVIYQELFDKLGLDESGITITDIESRVDPLNVKAVNWWVDRWATNYSELADVSLSVYNTKLGKDMNYTPYKYSKVKGVEVQSEDILEKVGGAFASSLDYVYDKKSGVLMESNVNSKMADGRYVDLDFDNSNSKALKSALVDINTAAATRQISTSLKSKAFEQIMPDLEDRVIFANRLRSYVVRSRNKVPATSDQISSFERLSRVIATLGGVKALGKVTQAVQQTVPVMMSTMTNTRGLFNPVESMGKSAKGFLDRSGRGIANRGQESSSNIEIANSILEKTGTSKVTDKLKYVEDLNAMWLKIFLSKPDVIIARSSWLAYYKQDLQRRGISTDIDYDNDPIDDEAADYAEHMVSRQQGVNDINKAGEFFASEDSWKKIMRNVLLPFSSFSLNQKSRMYSDWMTITSKTASWQDIWTAVASLSGLAVEMATYHGIGFAIRYYALMSIAHAITGEWPDEEEKKKILEGQRQYMAESIIKDVASPLPIADKYILGGLNGAISMWYDWTPDNEGAEKALQDKNESLILHGKEPLDEKSAIKFKEQWLEDDKFQFMNNSESTLGTYAIVGEKSSEFFDLVKMAYSGEVKVERDGKVSYKKISEKDREPAKQMVPFALLGLIGVLPAEALSVSKYVMKDLKGKSMTENQYEKMKDIKQELGRKELSKYEDYLVRSNRKKPGILDEIAFVERFGGLKGTQQDEYIKLMEKKGSVNYPDLKELQSGKTADEITKGSN